MKKQSEKLIMKDLIARIGLTFLFMIQAGILFSGLPAYGLEGDRKVCIFFDDGWKNQYDVALPILKEFGFKATFSIITDYIGMDNEPFGVE